MGITDRGGVRSEQSVLVPDTVLSRLMELSAGCVCCRGRSVFI